MLCLFSCQICLSYHAIRVKRISSHSSFSCTTMAIIPNRSCTAEGRKLLWWTVGRVCNSLEKSTAYDIKTILPRRETRHPDGDHWITGEWGINEMRTRERFRSSWGLLGKRCDVTNGANLCEGGRGRAKERKSNAPCAPHRKERGGVFTLHLWIYSCIHGRALRDDTRLSRAYHPPTSNSVHSNVSPAPRRRQWAPTVANNPPFL